MDIVEFAIFAVLLDKLFVSSGLYELTLLHTATAVSVAAKWQ